MVLQRTFTTSKSLFPEQTDPGSLYTVTRVYVGSVEPGSSGVTVVEGTISFHDSEATLGYFTLDGGVDAEMVVERAELAARYGVEHLLDEAAEKTRVED